MYCLKAMFFHPIDSEADSDRNFCGAPIHQVWVFKPPKLVDQALKKAEMEFCNNSIIAQ